MFAVRYEKGKEGCEVFEELTLKEVTNALKRDIFISDSFEFECYIIDQQDLFLTCRFIFKLSSEPLSWMLNGHVQEVPRVWLTTVKVRVTLRTRLWLKGFSQATKTVQGLEKVSHWEKLNVSGRTIHIRSYH